VVEIELTFPASLASPPSALWASAVPGFIRVFRDFGNQGGLLVCIAECVAFIDFGIGLDKIKTQNLGGV